MPRTSWSRVTAGLASTFLVFAAWTGAAGDNAQAQQQKFITIGTGGVTGVYYPSGGAMCRLMNKETDRHNIRCTVESTAASVANIKDVVQGELEFGIAQADWVYHASEGNKEFEGNPVSDLRTVFSIHAETITAVARADAGIESFRDFKGKRINVGDPGSGTLATNELLFEQFDMSFDDLALTAKLKSAEQAAALCDDNIDAYAWIVGHPSAGVSEATSTCDARLVPLDSPEIQELIEEQPYYSKTTIPGGLYEGNPDPVTTFGMRAVVVTSSEVPDEVVYEFTKAVFDNLGEFRSMHPALANLEPENMVSQGLNAPIHDGAMKYYKEAGLK
jgi:TRAP transporter TAXI family solute receptor